MGWVKKGSSKGFFHEMVTCSLVAEGCKRAKLEESREEHSRQREQQVPRP